VGFNAVLMSEHFGAFFAFGILHAALAIRYIKVHLLSMDHFDCLNIELLL
jgi:dolichyl-diphosphooligosaccharide--protein glycosyltransferase